MSSANSISLGRLLPQTAYYAQAALHSTWETGEVLNFVIPTGNLGNAMAAIMARAMGVPIGDIVLATNANDVLPDFFSGDDYAPQPSIATLANAMDVGAPSNFERLRWLYRRRCGTARGVHRRKRQRRQHPHTIREAPRRHGEVSCPHTATAVQVLEGLRAQGAAGDWAVAATAHPAKFESVVEPLIGHAVEPPPALAESLARPASAEPLQADYAALRERLLLAH